MVEGGWDDRGAGNVFVMGTVIILRNNYQSCRPLKEENPGFSAPLRTGEHLAAPATRNAGKTPHIEKQ